MMFALETMAGTMQTAAEKKYAILLGNECPQPERSLKWCRATWPWV